MLKIYPGAPHGLPSTHKEQLNADLLAFFKSIATGRLKDPSGRRSANRPADENDWKACLVRMTI